MKVNCLMSFLRLDRCILACLFMGLQVKTTAALNTLQRRFIQVFHNTDIVSFICHVAMKH